MKYLGNVITDNDISSWGACLKNSGSCKILISSHTGSGKSHFIKNKLSESFSGKILLITNRKILRQQVKAELEQSGNENISTINYQGLELIFQSKDNLFSGYDIVVFDEAHYLFSDSVFNRNTDLLLNFLKSPPKNKICIFMSATPDIILYYCKDFDFMYSLEDDYSYIDKLCFFSREESYDEILSSVAEGEKCLCFCSSAREAYEKSLKYKDSAFICSENNKKYYSNSSIEERQNLINYGKFNCKILFTTKVLDNGVNIKDEDLKNIIIDTSDPITFIQCLGRKRILNDKDKVNLYVKNYSGRSLAAISIKFSEKLKLVSELKEIGKSEFIKRYRKKNFDDIIDNDITINEAKYYNYKYYQNLYYNMRCDEDGKGYIKYICERLKINLKNIFILEEEFEKDNIQLLINEYYGKKIYPEEQDNFKNKFFGCILVPKKTDYRKRGIRSINGVLKELGFNFVLKSKVSSVDKQSFRYWCLELMES